jgi:hypothetical protein
MSIPGFTAPDSLYASSGYYATAPISGWSAESTLYRTSGYYNMAVGADSSGGFAVPAIAVPPYPPLPFPPPIPQPIGKCGKCYSSNGECVHDCTFTIPCPPGQLPDGCGRSTTATLRCTVPTPTCSSNQTASCGVCCPRGEVYCYDTCVNLSTDLNNCGACGNACGPGQTCSNGECVCPPWDPSYCPPSGCTNLMTDPQNCGTCDNACGPGQICSNATCVCLMAGQTYCPPGGCTDLMTDPQNCGACGNSCSPPQSCCAGECCEGGTCCLNDVCVSKAPAPPANGGNWNWPLYSSDCQNIQDLTVQLSVGPDPFVPAPASNGFSLQVNGYAPLGPGLPCHGIDWLQYILYVQNGKAWAQIQYWNNEICDNLPKGGCCWTTLGLANECDASCQGCKPCSAEGNTPWLPLGDKLFYQQLLPNNVPSTDIIPSESLLQIELKTNTLGQVTEALFYLIIDGVISSASYSFPPDQQYGFPAFVPVVVASPSSAVNFSSGSGQLYSSVCPGELCAQLEGAPGSICGVTWPGGTGETSNAVYGPTSPCCGSVLRQPVST